MFTVVCKAPKIFVGQIKEVISPPRTPRNYFRNTAVPPYLWGICLKTLNWYLKPRLLPNPMIFSSVYIPMVKFNS